MIGDGQDGRLPAGHKMPRPEAGQMSRRKVGGLLCARPISHVPGSVSLRTRNRVAMAAIAGSRTVVSTTLLRRSDARWYRCIPQAGTRWFGRRRRPRLRRMAGGGRQAGAKPSPGRPALEQRYWTRPPSPPAALPHPAAMLPESLAVASSPGRADDGAIAPVSARPGRHARPDQRCRKASTASGTNGSLTWNPWP
jgi:hypothetical protein